MADEPTAWEDINPTTALAKPVEQPLQRSGSLEPASTEKFAGELTACLALVAPAGMDEAGRREWLQVAWDTLKHLPADMLEIGCQAARQKCDHPAKIVPAILEATEQAMKWRKEAAGSDHLALPAPSKVPVMERRGQPMSQVDTDELNGILEYLGAAARYRTDGSRYLLKAAG